MAANPCSYGQISTANETCGPNLSIRHKAGNQRKGEKHTKQGENVTHCMCRPYLCALRGCCCLQLGIFNLDMMNLLGQFFWAFCGFGKPAQLIQRQPENAA